MDKNLDKKPFPRRRYVLLAIAIFLIARVVWLHPRTSWSLKNVPQKALHPEHLSQAPTPGKTSEISHVVLISIDTCRADHLGCYGYSRNTSPNIDAIAADGVLFNHAIAPTPITLPSHSSMLTGTTPLYHNVRDNHNYRLSEENVTLAEILQKEGFATGAVVGSFVLDSRFGLSQGFEAYNDNIEKGGRKRAGFHERDAQETTTFANAWLMRHSRKKSFLFLHYFDPHEPYVPHDDFVFTSYSFLNLTRDRYDGEIAYTDHCIGQVIKKLKELKIFDKTLLIITADHGESLGDHSEITHAYFIYHSTIHIPLIIKAPGGPKNVKVDQVTGLVDIVPTVCGFLGIAVPPEAEGRDVRAFFAPGSASKEARFIYSETLLPTKYGLSPILGLTGNRWKYLHSAKPELYDIVRDPHEKRDLFEKEHARVDLMQERLKAVLKNSIIESTMDSRKVLGADAVKRLKSLGYVAAQQVDDDIQFEQKGGDPKEFIKVHNLLGRLEPLMKDKKHDEAKKICNRILAKWPHIKEASFNAGLIAAIEKDEDAVIAHFSRYLERPASASSYELAESKRERAIAHLNIAITFKEKGDTEKAAPHFEKVLFYQPDDIELSIWMAEVCGRYGRISDAIRILQKAIGLCNSSGREDLAKDLEKKVELYRKKCSNVGEWKN